MVSSRRCWFMVLGVLALVLPPADIQAATPGSKVQIPVTTSPKRWPDVGYDAQNNVYLAVIGNGPIQGRFVSADGALLSSPLGAGTFNISTTAGFHQSPRVACGAGVCAVFWGQEGSPTVPTVRVISYTSGFVSAPTPIASTPGLLTEVGHGITFASGDNEFVAAWAYSGSVKFSRISLAGQLLQSTVIPAATGWKSGVYPAYNPVLDEVVVSFAGTKTVGGVPDVAFVSVQRVQNGALLGGPIDLATGGSTYIPMGEFNPTTNNVTVTYYKSAKFYAREVGAGGALGAVTLISSVAAYDALDVAYNANAGRFLLVTHGPSVEDVAVEFTPALVPSPYFTLTSNGGNGNYNPRVVSHGTDAKWLAVTSNNFSTLWAQFAVGSTCTSNCGGGNPSPPPPPPPPPPPTCTVTVSGASANVAASGGTGSIGVSVSATPCSWSASSSAAWITVTPTSGTASGAVVYTVLPNLATSPRSATVTVAGQAYSISQAKRSKVLVDFDVDGKGDAAFYRPANGQWYARLSTTSQLQSVPWAGAAGDIPVMGDFDGDTRPDPTFFRPSDGCWYILASYTGTASYVCWGGQAQDKPVAADYDGDGKTDPAFYRPSDRYWYILLSSTGASRYVYWGGQSTDQPAPGDYDGDQKADVAFYRPTDKFWYIIKSSTGGAWYVQYGSGSNDRAVPADYDGDGKTDHAYFRATDGYWYIRQSSTGTTKYAYWGNGLTNQPVPADYDGDGKADIAFFEAPYFYIISSTTGLATYYYFGSSGDIAVSK